MAAPAMPPRAYGRTALRIISQRVAPSASAASLRWVGTVGMISRETAVTIGRIMIARISPAMKQFGPHRAADERQERRRVREHCSAGMTGRQDEEAPQAVDDAGNGGQQRDQEGERLAHPPGPSSVMYTAHATPPAPR